jgi:hypothetical protein
VAGQSAGIGGRAAARSRGGITGVATRASRRGLLISSPYRVVGRVLACLLLDIVGSSDCGEMVAPLFVRDFEYLAGCDQGVGRSRYHPRAFLLSLSSLLRATVGLAVLCVYVREQHGVRARCYY